MSATNAFDINVTFHKNHSCWAGFSWAPSCSQPVSLQFDQCPVKIAGKEALVCLTFFWVQLGFPCSLCDTVDAQTFA